eukprot:206242_1
MSNGMSQSASQLLSGIELRELRERFISLPEKIVNSLKRATSKERIKKGTSPRSQTHDIEPKPIPGIDEGTSSWRIGWKVLYHRDGITQTVVIEDIQPVDKNDSDRADLITIKCDNGQCHTLQRHKLSSCTQYTQNKRKITLYCIVDLYTSGKRDPFYIHDFGFIKGTGPKSTNGQWFSVNNHSVHRWSSKLQCSSELLKLKHGSMCLVFDDNSAKWCYGKIVKVKSERVDEKTKSKLAVQNNIRLKLDIFTIHYYKNGKIYSKSLHQFSASLASINPETLSGTESDAYAIAKRSLHTDSEIPHAASSNISIDYTDLIYYRRLIRGFCKDHEVMIPNDLLFELVKYTSNGSYDFVMAVERKTYVSAFRHRKKKTIHVLTPPTPVTSTTQPMDVSLCVPSENVITSTDHQSQLTEETFHENVKTSVLYRSHHGFCEAIGRGDSSSMLNDRTLYLLLQCIEPYVSNDKYKLLEFVKVSIANKTPIAQFIMDIYGECVLKYGFTINDFMAQSKFLSLLSSQSIASDPKCWNLIRTYLSDYCKYLYEPIRRDLFEKNVDDFSDDDDDCSAHTASKIEHMNIPPHPMSVSRMSYYISEIHRNIKLGLPRVHQVDVVFITKHSQQFNTLNDEYFIHSKLKFERLYDHNYSQMMHRFNNKLDEMKFTRCVICILATADICNDVVYIFEPSHHHSLPPEISNYTELPWICNTKSEVLSDLCVSFHRYLNEGSGETERVYLHYHSYYARLFEHNVVDILTIICANTSAPHESPTLPVVDRQYHAFLCTYFADLELMKPHLNYLIQHKSDELYENKWSHCWHRYFVRDTQSMEPCEYMYRLD